VYRTASTEEKIRADYLSFTEPSLRNGKMKIGHFTFTCEACGKMETHESSLGATFPFGWYFRRLDSYGRLVRNGGKSYLLCKECGNRDHYGDGISEQLRENFRKRKIFFKKNPCPDKQQQVIKKGGRSSKSKWRLT
jgi:hypothetical protein